MALSLYTGVITYHTRFFTKKGSDIAKSLVSALGLWDTLGRMHKNHTWTSDIHLTISIHVETGRQL